MCANLAKISTQFIYIKVGSESYDQLKTYHIKKGLFGQTRSHMKY